MFTVTTLTGEIAWCRMDSTSSKPNPASENSLRKSARSSTILGSVDLPPERAFTATESLTLCRYS